MASKSAILSVKILGNARPLVKELGLSQRALGGFQRGISTLAKGAAVIGAAGTAALGALAVSGIKAAGDLEQSTGAVETVFKQHAGKVLGYSQNAATALGLTKNEYNEMATLIGTQLKVGGTSLDELGDKTNRLMTLSADLSSMFGGSSADAAAAISSALKGERDPIERYGISLKQATIDAKAAELGFKKVNGSLSDQAQQAATLALIFDQSKDAQGNFARETNTYAGQLAIFRAQFGNFQAQVGQIFLPVLTKVMTLLTGALMPGLQKFADLVGPKISAAIGLVSPYIERFANWLGALVSPGAAVSGWAAQFTPILSTLGEKVTTAGTAILAAGRAALPSLIGAAKSLTPIITGIATKIFPAWIKAVGVIVPIIIRLWSNVLPGLAQGLGFIGAALIPLVADFLNFGAALYEYLGPALEFVAAFGGVLLKVFGAAVAGAIFVVGGTIKAFATLAVIAFKGILTAGTAIINFFANTLPNGIQSFYNSAKQFFLGIRQGLSDAWEGIKTGFANLGESIGGFFTGLGDLYTGAVTAAKKWVSDSLAAAGEWLSGIIEKAHAVGASIGGALSGIASRVAQWLTGLGQAYRRGWNRLVEVTSNVLSGIGRAVVSGVTSAGAFLVNGWRNAIRAAVNVIRALANGVHSVFATVTGAVSRGVSAVAGYMLRGFGRARDSAVRAFSGLGRGVANVMGGVISTVQRIPGRVIGIFNSLTRAMFTIGRYIIQGLTNGITSMVGGLYNKVYGVVGGIKNYAMQLLGIRSPSRVFAEIGRFTGQGFIVGLDQTASGIQAAMRAAIAPPTAELPEIAAPRYAGGRRPAAGQGQTVINLNVSGFMDSADAAREIEQALHRLFRSEGRGPKFA
ncbi:phage tail protein [Dermabacteraceae bacterium P7006]